MIEDVYPLSPLQEGMYYHWLNAPDASVYLMQTSYRLKGSFNIDLLEKSYRRLVTRHAALRTFFVQEFGEKLLQVVKKEIDPSFIYIDAATAPNFSLDKYKAQDRTKNFNLHAGSQVRLTVISLDSDTYEFIWTHHHIIMDGWCTNILLREFFQIYACFAEGREPTMKKVYPYSAYINWLTQVDEVRSLTYWKNYLFEYDTVCVLPKANAVYKPGYQAGEVDFQLSTPLRQSIRNLCAESGVTENTFIQTAWGILLGKYNDTTDVVFGAVVSGRPPEVEGVEDMVGLFINTIPVRIQTAEKFITRDLLKTVQQNYLEGSPYHYTQLAQIQTESGLGNNLFDHIIQFQNLPALEKEDQDDKKNSRNTKLSLESYGAFGDNTFDLTCLVVPTDTSISFVFKYNINVYEEAMVRRLQVHLQKIIEALVANESIDLGAIDYLGDEEKQQLLDVFSPGEAFQGVNETVIELFDKQVAAHPDAIAILYDGIQFTYQELAQKVNALAVHLRTAYAIGANTLVGIMMERSEAAMVAILGVLKAGGAYVSIDFNYPPHRKEFIMKDTGINLLLTHAKYVFDLQYYTGEIFTMDVQFKELVVTGEVPSFDPQPDALAYVIYTSGSTGTPKGCCVTNANLAGYINWANRFYFPESAPSFAWFTSLTFDLTATSIFCSLTSGSMLTIYSIHKELSDILTDCFDKSPVNAIKLTPSHINLLKLLPISNTGIACAIVGGEEVMPEQVNILKKLNPAIRIFNEYGPTETTVGCVVKQLERNAPVYIGRPVAGTAIYIVDRYGRPCPVGVAGEICISGSGVAKGYLNQPELTAEKFITCPFKNGERMYRTGDLGRWRNNGDLEFIGRKDNQVKIHGYRIEPAEIEKLLQSSPLIQAAVVVPWANRDGEKELVAYIVSDQVADVLEIRAFLERSLPFYMIPNHFVRIENVPLTSHGKVDKKALPVPRGRGIGADIPYVAPRNEIEEKLVQIWQEILGKEKVGVKDNFFALGGHSLKVIQLISRINAVFAVRIGVQNVFDDPTIENLYEHISFHLGQQNQKQNTEKMVQVNI